MKNTWHFTLPETLLQPTVDRLAVQQDLFTLTAPNLRELLSLFQTFSAYADLPLGLNPKRRRELREELHALKTSPNIRSADIAQLVKKIKTIKEDYRQQKALAHQQQRPIFVTYANEDLHYIALKILGPIENYLHNAKNELKKCKPPQQTDHPLRVFSNFIKTTEARLQEHQRTIAECMLLRLQDIDANSHIQDLSSEEFRAFHSYIQEQGDPQIHERLKALSWIKNNTTSLSAIIKPKRPRWPRWLFRGSNTLHSAFGDTYHQVALTLQIKRLKSIDPDDLNALITVEEIHQALTKEIQRITKLRGKLFRLFHSHEYQRLSNRMQQLNTHRQQATQLQEKIQRKIDTVAAEHRKKQEKREALLKRVDKYNAESVELFQLTLLKRIHSSSPDDFSEVQKLVERLGDMEIKAIWEHHLDQYRLQCFTKVILDSKNSEILLSEFLCVLGQTSVPFPATEMVSQQLMHLIKQVPAPDWTEHQHVACEALDSHLILSEYYSRALDCYSLADLIIRRFADEQLTEIEFPELKEPLEKLIQRRLIEKEANATASLVKAEIEHGHVSFALSQLSRLQHNLKDEAAKQRLVLVSEALTETTDSPQELSHQLIIRLKKLLNRKTPAATYLEEFSQLKSLSEQLPYSQEYVSIKRLCAAGPNIPHIFNELPNAILALASGETQHIALINPLLLDIIDADLIFPEKQSLILQLIDAALIDPQNTLPLKEKHRLLSLKKCMVGEDDAHDRAAFIDQLSLNPHRLTSLEILITDEQQKGNTHEPTI